MVTTTSVVTTAPSVTVATLSSSGGTVPRSSVLPGAGDLASAAQDLLQRNEGDAPTNSHLPGYSGPTMKDL